MSTSIDPRVVGGTHYYKSIHRNRYLASSPASTVTPRKTDRFAFAFIDLPGDPCEIACVLYAGVSLAAIAVIAGKTLRSCPARTAVRTEFPTFHGHIAIDMYVGRRGAGMQTTHGRRLGSI